MLNMVSSDSSQSNTDHVTQIFLSAGLHGKLTGAGGGGFAFALVPSSMAESTVEKVRESLQTEGFTVLRTKVGGKGAEVVLDVV